MWENLYSEASELQINKVNPLIRALYDFLEAISGLQSYFLTLWQDKLTEKSENNKSTLLFFDVIK
jgi:hypothetical protein